MEDELDVKPIIEALRRMADQLEAGLPVMREMKKRTAKFGAGSRWEGPTIVKVKVQDRDGLEFIKANLQSVIPIGERKG